MKKHGSKADNMKNPNKKAERQEEILQILQKKNGASMKYLAQKLNVSDMTIRRDLSELEFREAVTLIQGVAIYNHPVVPANKEYNIAEASDIHRNEKNKIGQKAAALLEKDDVIIIDTGTTTEYLARHIPADLRLTALCYNKNTLIELTKRSNIKIIMPGGYYHPNTQMFESPEGLSIIKRTCANKAFISAAGITPKLDVTCMDQYEIDAKKTAIQSSIMKILVADSSKFDKICPALFARVSDFDVLVTDGNLSREWRDRLQEEGIRII